MLQDAADLKARRAAAGWSQRDLAREAGMHVQTVKYWESQTGAIGTRIPDRIEAAFASAGIVSEILLPPPTRRKLPDVGNIDDLGRCGARARNGKPCQARAVPGRNRCKFHGGRSTGPTSSAGRARIAAAQANRWKHWRDRRDQPASVETAN